MIHIQVAANTENEPEPLLKAGIAHLWFIMIHPFDDGNGRIARAVTDYQLARCYPSLMELVSFSKYISQDRKGYYSVLEAAGKNGMDITPWLKWFLQTFEVALQESQWIVEWVVTKARFWQQHGNDSLNARQQKVINRLLDCGDRFEGGMTSRKYAGMTPGAVQSPPVVIWPTWWIKIFCKNDQVAAGVRATNYIPYN